MSKKQKKVKTAEKENNTILRLLYNFRLLLYIEEEIAPRNRIIRRAEKDSGFPFAPFAKVELWCCVGRTGGGWCIIRKFELSTDLMI